MEEDFDHATFKREIEMLDARGFFSNLWSTIKEHATGALNNLSCKDCSGGNDGGDAGGDAGDDAGDDDDLFRECRLGPLPPAKSEILTEAVFKNSAISSHSLLSIYPFNASACLGA